MAAVAGNAGVYDLMLGDQLVELLPEIEVLHRRRIRSAPAPPPVGLPFDHPLAEPLANVLAVGEQLDVRRPSQGFEAADDGGQLHAVVRRLALAAETFDFL